MATTCRGFQLSLATKAKGNVSSRQNNALRASAKTSSLKAVAYKQACVAASTSTSDAELSRRQMLAASAVALSASLSAQPASAAGIPNGFAPFVDLQDGYQFIFPFGWQEVSVQGADVVYKDVIEPLESVSITLVDVAETKDIKELGSPEEVAATLIGNALTDANTTPKILNASSREVAGTTYYTFEFTTTKNYTRHALSTVAIGNGKLYTLTTGANERRWKKMKKKLELVAKSFEVTFASSRGPI